jgi:hypothetical protein
VENGQFVRYLKRKALSAVFYRENLLFLKRIRRRGLNRLRNMLIGRSNKGMRSSGVTRRGYSLGGIRGSGQLVRLGGRRYITRIAYNISIERRLDGCFREV